MRKYHLLYFKQEIATYHQRYNIHKNKNNKNQVNIIAPVFVLNTRESVSTTFQVISQAGAHCPPILLSITSSNVKASLVPTSFTLRPGETRNSVIMFTAPLGM